MTIGSEYTGSYTFDSSNRPLSVTRWILGQTYDTRKTYTTSYEYNGGSQLSKMIYPSGQQVSVNHDDKGRMQSLTYDPGAATGYLTGMGYNIAGQVTGLTLGNGVAESFGYDANRLQMTTQTATKGAASLMNLTYNYQTSAGQMGAGTNAGNAGQLMAISGTINATTESAAYTYDLLGRLVTSNQTSNGASAQRRFTYDRWGNRTGEWDATSGGNQIQSIALQQSGGAPTNRITSVTGGSTVNYTYDAAGNVTNDGVHSYTYDAANRLVSVDGGATAQYKYDHQNRRVSKIVGSSWTHYIWQGSHVIAEHDATTGYTTNPTYQVNSARLDYIYSGSQMISSRERASSGGTWTTKYYLSDRLSTRLVLDTSGSVIGRQAHLPFGEDFAQSGSQEKHHFTTYQRDGEAGTDYAVNRQYSQSIGRFNRVDPLASSGKKESPQSWNRYAYATSDPINMKDPLGLFEAGPEYLDPCSYGGATIIIDGLSFYPSLMCLEFSELIPANPDPLPPPPPPERDCSPIVEVALLPGNLRLSGNGLDLIRGFEAFVGHLYNDAASNCTIGYGHLLHLGPCNAADTAQYPNGITRQQGEALLLRDVGPFETAVNNSVTVPLMQNQFDALVSFAFNVGAGNFQGSTMLRELNRGNYNAVPDELLRWNRAGGRPLRGLTRRRQAEGDMFCSHSVPGYRPGPI